MKNINKVLCILVLLILGAFHSTDKKGYKVTKIVIDAGHGGKDAGCAGKFSKEKDVALKIALKLGALIKRHMRDVRIIYTRKTDQFVPLYERACIANRNNADVFISIHCNASLNDKSYGTETYTMGLNTSKDNLVLVKRENGVILVEDSYEKNYPGFDPNAPESYILFSLYQNAYNENSLKLAQNIQEEFKNRVGRKSRGVKQAELIVLWKTTAASVLVEVGFLTHLQEEKYLNKLAGQNAISAGIFRALQNYKKEIEAKI